MRFLDSIIWIYIFFQSITIDSQKCWDYFPIRKADINQTYICPESMINDLVELKKTLLEVHPNPYLYQEKGKFDFAYEQAIKAASTEKTMTEFAMIVSDFINSIHDSHTNLNPRDILYMGYNRKMICPFNIVRIDSSFYLEKIYKNGLRVGTKIISFNSMSSDSLFRLSKRLCFIEGNAQDAQNEVATRLMGIVFNWVNKENKIELAYVDTTGKKGTFACPMMEVKKTKKGRGWFDEDELTYFFDEKNRGILIIKSFEAISLRSFQKEVDAFFIEVRKRQTKEIYIDLRDNKGGLIRAQEYIMSYLNYTKKNHQINYLYKRSKYDRFSLLPFYQEWQFARMAKRAYPKGIISKEFDFYKSEMGTQMNILYDYLPKNRTNQTFDGECTLIMNGFSMSASAMLAAWFKETQRGKIIGTPCMGTLSGTFGNAAVIFLENSRIPISVSTLKFTPVKYEKIELEAVQPDQRIEYKLDDLIFHRDPVFQILQIRLPQKFK